jgi:hypothetical protein
MLRQILVSLSTALLIAQAPLPKLTHTSLKSPAAEPEDKVLGRVGTRVFKESDFEHFLATALTPQQRKQMGSAPGNLDKFRKQFLNFQIMVSTNQRNFLSSGS